MWKQWYLLLSRISSSFFRNLWDLTSTNCFLSVNGLWRKSYLIQRLLLQTIWRNSLVSVPRIVMNRNPFLVAVITRGTASFLLRAARSFLHAYGVTMKLLIIVWTGECLELVSITICRSWFIYFFFLRYPNSRSDALAERLSLRWCVWTVWRYNQWVLVAQIPPVMASPWVDTIAKFANCLKMKGEKIRFTFSHWFGWVPYIALKSCING